MSIFARILPATLLVGSLIFSAQAVASQAPEAIQDSTAGLADEAVTPALEKPEPIKHLENQGLEVVRNFPVGRSLVGWVVSFDGKDLVVYTTADGEYLINGVILDAQGVDLTEEHQRSWLPRPEWQDMETAHYLTESSLYQNEDGQTETRFSLYMFFDPNCPFSQLAWVAMQPYREAGAEIRWIPVAYLKPDSRHRAAALLDAEQPAELLALNMENFGQSVAELDVAIENHHREQLQANMDLMQSLGINGTPGWVWLDEEDELKTLSGMPRLPRLAEITGLPRQEHPETELMRYR
ncbi:thiol:disulfide interchange protein DsbG [Marinospirillum celere]|uniref:Thiol:disulfide interchange protein DsbG n=1 Tax=Marinospirillum celere TaxID=1122252 RepID=A0A1I1HRT5_9GAMM|nr:thiol:disulfide interchange protein DsbG [Marinospirillum celere]SFC26807.1 thiol:disulfide interchange protein DsbG [Marinospirillum celere]